MNRNNLLTRVVAMLALFGALAVGDNVAQAQPASTAASGAAEDENDTVVLSPFEVQAEQDTGYLAASLDARRYRLSRERPGE
jgi:hypothetical protein